MASQHSERGTFYPDDAEDIEDVRGYGEFEDVEDVEDDLDDDEGYEAYEDDLDDDEDVEAFEDDLDDDEDVEDDYDDDEAYETYEDDLDDDDEDVEVGVFEDDLDDDEDVEDDYDDDEALEAAEAIEDVGETPAAAERSRRSRRYRARMRARARRRRMLRRRRAMAASRRRAIALARAARSKLGRSLRGGLMIRRPRIRKLGKLRGRGVVTARLPNGRTTRMMIIPPMAKQRDVNRLTSRITANDRRTAKALRSQGLAIARLRKAQAATVKTLTAQQVKSDKALAKQIAAGDSRLDKRMTKEVGAQRKALARHRRRSMTMMRDLNRKSLLNALTVGAALPAFAAYGERSDLLSARNLSLTGILGASLLADELFDYALPARGKRGRAIRVGSSVVSYAAPFITPVASYLLYKDDLHERFVSGVATSVSVDDGATISIATAAGVDSSAVSSLSGTPVLVSIVDSSNVPAAASLTAVGRIENGNVMISFIDANAAAAGTNVSVAWAADVKPAA